MKINYLLYSVAFASAFAACSDELAEVANAPVNEALAGRPVVGNVTLNVSKAGEAETRLNEAGTGFLKGETIHLFLMDEFNLGTEKLNANFTPWKQQDVWFDMYNMVDYIHTNYAYVAQEDGGDSFVNNASQLVEGNYFAFYQEDESYRAHEITNRQDLWVRVKPEVVLETTKNPNVYKNVQNDFYLDYQQVYRDEDGANGVLALEMGMKPVMNRVKFTIGNLNNAQYRVRSITIRKNDGSAVPNIAYVRPASLNKWNNEVMNDDFRKGDFASYEALVAGDPVLEPAFLNKFTKEVMYDDYAGNTIEYYLYNGGKKAFTQADARTITYFETTANGKVPYGMKQEDAVPAFAYTIKFPGEGHLLNAHAPFTSQERVDVYFALPVFAGEVGTNPEQYSITVEGDYFDITKGDPSDPGEWVAGFWSAGLPSGLANTKWQMEKAFAYDWTSALGQAWPTGTLTIDFNDMHLYGDPSDVLSTNPYRVNTTEELINVLKSDYEFGNILTQIELNNIGIKFDDEVKAQIKANAAKYLAGHPLPAPQYSVQFTYTADFKQEWLQKEFEETITVGSNDYGDAALYDYFNKILNVTAEDVLDLPTNILDIPACYTANQTVNKDINITTETLFAATLNIADDVTVSGNGNLYLLNGAVVNLNDKGHLKDVKIWFENEAVTVKGTSKNATITGRNYAKVILPRKDVFYIKDKGTANAKTIWYGINDVIDASGLTTYSTGILSYPAALAVTPFEVPEASPVADYVIAVDGEKDYKVVAGVVSEDKGDVEPFKVLE